MKALTLFTVLALVLLIVGCTPRYEPRPGVAAGTAAIPGEAGVVSQDVSSVDSLDKELGVDELEELDQDLDLGL